MAFKEILYELLTDFDLTIPKLADRLKIPHTTIYDYKNHNALPSIEYAYRIAKYFSCSINYLMGLSENPNDIKLNQNYDIDKFFPRYIGLLSSKNITNYKFCKITQVNESSYNLWSKGATPKMETLIKIADYFGCSIDYLIGYSDEI